MNDIVFMGTPDFAAASLQALYDNGFSVKAVFCQPDKPKNRGMKLVPCEVKVLAQEHGTPVYQPTSLKTGEVVALIRELKPAVIVAVAYGKLLPDEILAIPAFGCINIHGSLLPKYRGSAPIQWTILNGDSVAGVTAMYMEKELDAGDIIKTRETPVQNGETAGELFERLAPLGGQLLVDTLEAVFSGTADRQPQNPNLVSYAPPLSREQSPVNWSLSAEQVLCHIRGLHPWPCATAEIQGTVFKLHTAEFVLQTDKASPGTILEAGNNGLIISCGQNAVRIVELQVPGGKRMRAVDYLRGHPLCL